MYILSHTVSDLSWTVGWAGPKVATGRA